MPWPDHLFVVDPAPIVGVVEQLGRKGGRVAVARCPGQSDAEAAGDWWWTGCPGSPDLDVTTRIDAGCGGYLLVLETR